MVKLPRCKCLRCGHVWTPRKDGLPRFCGRCKSPHWNQKGYVDGRVSQSRPAPTDAR